MLTFPFSPEGSLTLHHWQQLAKPHLATILDPHPGVVTKGFQPLPQDPVYRLTDLEEDEEHEKGDRREGWQEDRERKRGEEEEEEEGGITFNVQSSSTPEERRDKTSVHTPVKVPPLTPSLRGSPFAVASTVSVAATASLMTSGLSVTSTPVGSAAKSPLPSLNINTTAPSTGEPLSLHSQHCYRNILEKTHAHYFPFTPKCSLSCSYL